MIEVKTKLVGGSVFAPGDSVICCVTFLNKIDTGDKKQKETLAWASAQVDCICSTNSKYPVFPNSETNPSQSATNLINADTSLKPLKSNEKGFIALSTKPKILFCDLNLPPGASKTFIFREALPPDAPPHYLGKLARYTYKITIGTQRLNCPIKLLRVPIRVLAIAGIADCNINDDSEDLTPNNPFVEAKIKEQEVGPALQIVQNITARRSPNFYNITNTRGKVGRFCIFKQAYRLGEDIVGTFDFSTSTVPCLQVTVTLQSEEKITEDYKPHFKQDSALIAYSKHHEICLQMEYCQLVLPIPLHATPAFNTKLISLSWKLHFEFVTSHPGSTEVVLTGDTWQAPESVLIETMVWDLPIQIYPTIPTPERTHPEFSIVF